MSFPKLSFINNDDDCDSYATNNYTVNSYKAWWACTRWLAGGWWSSSLSLCLLIPLSSEHDPLKQSPKKKTQNQKAEHKQRHTFALPFLPSTLLDPLTSWACLGDMYTSTSC